MLGLSQKSKLPDKEIEKTVLTLLKTTKESIRIASLSAIAYHPDQKFLGLETVKVLDGITTRVQGLTLSVSHTEGFLACQVISQIDKSLSLESVSNIVKSAADSTKPFFLFSEKHISKAKLEADQMALFRAWTNILTVHSAKLPRPVTEFVLYNLVTAAVADSSLRVRKCASEALVAITSSSTLHPSLLNNDAIVSSSVAAMIRFLLDVIYKISIIANSLD